MSYSSRTDRATVLVNDLSNDRKLDRKFSKIEIRFLSNDRNFVIEN